MEYTRNVRQAGDENLQEENVANIARSTAQHTMLAEFVRNGMEAPIAEGVAGRNIIFEAINYNGMEKLSIFNDCQGMSKDQLDELCNLSVRGEKADNSAFVNYGQGARISGLAASPAGMIYQSSRSGKVHQVAFNIHIDGAHPNGDPSYKMGMTDVVEVDGDADSEWTRVIFVGRDEDTDTVKYPWEGGRIYPVGREFMGRFFRVSDGISVRAFGRIIGEKGIKKQNYNNLWTAEKWMNSVANKDYEIIEHNGLKIHYARNVDIGAKKSAGGFSGAATRGGIVYRNEIFNSLELRDWRHAANGIGLTDIGGKVSVFVELPDNYPVHTDPTREEIMHNRTNIRLRIADDFSLEVKDARPEWVVNLVNETADATRSAKEEEVSDFARKAIMEFTKGFYALESRKGADKKGGDDCEDATGKQKHDGHGVIPNHKKPRKTKRCKDGDTTEAKETEMFMPIPDIKVVYKNDDAYEEVENYPMTVSYYLGSKNPAILRVNGEHPVIKSAMSSLTKKSMDKYNKSIDPKTILSEVMSEVELHVCNFVNMGFISALANGEMYSYSNTARKESIKGNVIGGHIMHIRQKEGEMFNDIKRRFG